MKHLNLDMIDNIYAYDVHINIYTQTKTWFTATDLSLKLKISSDIGYKPESFIPATTVVHSGQKVHENRSNLVQSFTTLNLGFL